jgi:hypothetical protein
MISSDGTCSHRPGSRLILGGNFQLFFVVFTSRVELQPTEADGWPIHKSTMTCLLSGWIRF